MLFSLFSTRIVPRLLVGPPLLRNVAKPMVNRRVAFASPFSTSRLVSLPATAASRSTTAKKSSDTSKSDAKPARKMKTATTSGKTTKKKSVVKPATKKKQATNKVKAGAGAAKKAAAKKETYKITKEDKPPGLPLHAYTLFAKKYLRAAYATETDAPRSLERSQSLLKSAGATWKAMSEHEKQAFRDEAAVLSEEYRRKRQHYNETASTAIVRQLNKIRKKQGKKSRIRIPSKFPKPATAFVRFYREISGELRRGGNFNRSSDVVREAGRRWKELPDTEKKPYFDGYRAEVADWKAKQQSA